MSKYTKRTQKTAGILLLSFIIIFGTIYLYSAGTTDKDLFAVVYKGDSKNYRFTVRNVYTYDAVDLTDLIVKFRVKKSPSDGSYDIDKTCTLLDATNGQATVALSIADTSIDTGTYYAYLILTNAGGTVYETLLKSKWIVSQ